MRRRSTVWILSLLLATGVATVAGQRAPVPPADFGQWETLIPQPGASSTGPLSPDGAWLVYGIDRSDRRNELRFLNLATGETSAAPFGKQPSFSADSRWLAHAIGYSEDEEEKLKKEKKPIHNKLGLRNLGSGETTVVDEIESFAFDATGAYLAMRRYAPEPPAEPKEEGAGASPEPADAEAPRGATLIVRSLATGVQTTFGHVAEFAWQSKGRLLAMTVSAEDKVGNGIQVFDPATGALRVLDSSDSVYAAVAWRKDADDLVVLRSRSDERREQPAHVALAWTGLGTGAGEPRRYDPAADPGFPPHLRIVSARRPSWSEDGRVVFLGVGAWDEKPAAPAGENAAAQSDPEKPAASDDEAPAAVQVWHPRDVDVMPKQQRNVASDRRRNMLAAWHVAAGRLVRLAVNAEEDVQPLGSWTHAYGIDPVPYGMERSFGRRYSDLFVVDLMEGRRVTAAQRIEDAYVQASPAGRYLLYFQNDNYWTYDVATGVRVNITGRLPASFANLESDWTVLQKPPHGVAGWTVEDASVLLYDEFDIWEVRPDGSGAARLTRGAADEVRHRVVPLDPEAKAFPRDRPIHVSLEGKWTKRAGYARFSLPPHAPAGDVLAAGTNVERLVWEDKRVNRLAKAKDAEVFAYVVQAFDDSPDYFAGGPHLAAARRVTETNPFQARYAWGRAELIEYKSPAGKRLQGALLYPAAFEAGRPYPMVVYVYERLSSAVHVYASPSARSPYNAAVLTSLGYFVLMPDIVFRRREPGLSVVECVSAAVKSALATGHIDARRIGVMGHSWGGFDASFLAAKTKLFAAAVAGAPITNLVSNYGNHHWTPGIAETDHIETGQQRMEVPLWEDLPAYIRNSPVFGAHKMTTPLLVAFGDDDGVVHWHQGVELYNIARRAGRQVVLLVYEGEEHMLQKKANQLDYQRRILEWFGHYLKGEPAPPWIERGVSHLERERMLERLKRSRGTND